LVKGWLGGGRRASKPVFLEPLRGEEKVKKFHNCLSKIETLKNKKLEDEKDISQG